MKIELKKQQQQEHRHKTTKGLWLFWLLSQKKNDLMDEIEDSDDDIDVYKLVFIGSNREIFNFNIFRRPLNFLSAMYNGEITFKKAEILQRDLDKNIKKLKFNYKAKNVEEKEEIDKVLMHANDMLGYRDKIIEVLRDGTFSSEHLI